MIKYKETIDRGFKRKDLGNDSVWFDEFGYEWFITEKVIIKLKKGNITANWCPETKTIEVMRLIDGLVKSRKSFKTLEEFDYLSSLHCSQLMKEYLF
jgi:hypothetical protein